MATPGKSQNARRRDVRRAVPRPRRAWHEAWRQRDVGWATLYILAFGVVAAAVAVSVRDRPGYYLGQTVAEPVFARVQFEAIDIEATDRNRDFARRSEPLVFRPNRNLMTDVEARLSGLLGLADRAYEDLNQDYLGSVRLTPAGHDLLKRYAKGVDPDGPYSPARWSGHVRRLTANLFDQVVLDMAEYRQLTDGPGNLRFFHPLPRAGEPAEVPRSAGLVRVIDDPDRVRELVETVVVQVRELPRELRRTAAAVILADLGPTYFFDADTTRQRRQAVFDATPPVSVTYRPDDVLVRSGSRLTADDLELLGAEQAALTAQRPATRLGLRWLGAAGLMVLLGLGVWAYVFAYNRQIRRNPMRGLALTGMLLLCQGIAVALTGVWPQIALGAVAFATLLGAVIFAIVYDQRFALAMGLAVTALIVVSLRLPMTAAIVMMAGVVVAVAQLDEVRSRSKLVSVGLWSGLAMGLATAVGGLAERSFDLPSIWNVPLLGVDVSAQWGLLARDAGYTVLSGFGVGLLVQGILPGIEKVFHVTTAMTLRELNDAGHPLLQRLAQESAGTYQHSLRIADMTEAAADAVGADGLLCRVGAMYHDIGKINKPSYFIENQGGGPNKHNKLSPAMSLLIIVGHVKDGVEMAREYNLPPAVRHFIESHHGTTLVEYFYHAAKQQKAAEDKAAPSEFEFRYPGPKPQTKEAAIMLLCDGIEGAARAMDEPTAVRLEQLVHAMANKRLMDGQFDECNLTLRDLARVEAAVTKTLCAVYHSRIKYPGGKKDETPAEAKASA
ncbi:MAG: HDIG domain-containing metalloprotein [Planctomycetota bacterium]